MQFKIIQKNIIGIACEKKLNQRPLRQWEIRKLEKNL